MSSAGPEQRPHTGNESRAPLTQIVAGFAEGFRLAHAPAAAIENAKIAILDCLGVSVLANAFEVGRAMAKFLDATAAPGPCTVWGTARKVAPRDAVFANGTLAHGLDFDDRNHSSTYSLAVPFALGEQRGLQGAVLLEAFIVGREVRNSLDHLFAHRGSGIGPGSKGWHSNGILGPIASACAAGRALGLDPRTIQTAAGLAAGSCGALTRDGGTMAKPFRCGHAGATGLACAIMAQSGFTADAAAIEGARGLLDALGPLEPQVVAPLAKSLGREFQLAKPIRGKRFASCSASHPGIEAMLRLRQRLDLKVTDIVAIECDLKPFPLLRGRPASGVEARFSLPFCLALALVNGQVLPSDFNDQLVGDADVQRLIATVSHRPGSEHIEVRLVGGDVLSEPLQRATDFTTFDEIAVKFSACAEGILAPDNIARTVETVRGLERLEDARALGSLLRTS